MSCPFLSFDPGAFAVLGKLASFTGVPCSKSGAVSPVVLLISAASSLTWGSWSWLGLCGLAGPFSSAKPLKGATGANLALWEAIEGLVRIASVRLKPSRFNRGGMVVIACLQF